MYQIKDWDNHFENNRSRGIVDTDWVPIPNKQDGDGYTELMADKNGTLFLGCWIALVELASKCHPRGTLVRSDGRPHDIPSMSRITRVPEAIIKQTLPKLISIGWIITSGTAPDCHQMAPDCPEGREGIEGKGKERKVKEPKDKYLDFVYLTKEEYQKLSDQFPDLKDRLQRLNNYIGQKGDKYKSHYHTVIAWADKDKQASKPTDIYANIARAD